MNQLLSTTYALFLGVCFPLFVFAQQPTSYCGTPAHRSAWLKAYQAQPASYHRGGDTTLFLPVVIHSVAADDSTGHLSILKILEGFCALNQDFAPTNIQFFIEGDIRRIHKTEWSNHDSLLAGYQMMTQSNQPNAVNCYIVANPAGNAGYNLPSANAVALVRNSIGAGDHTWAHELGHNFSLPHPFLGWEGKTYDYQQPTPLKVTYNYTQFKPIFYTDTLIIDTAFVEFTDSSNCTIAADGFCDTKPDYLSYRWNCNAAKESNALQKDPNNVNFKSDGTLIMSYAADNCQARFSPQQIAAMRANIFSTKATYLYNQNPVHQPINDPLALLEPANTSTANAAQSTFRWNTAPNATHYVLQISLFTNFALPHAELLTTDTAALVANFIPNRKYYWRVKPFNQGYTCAPFSNTQTFTAVGTAATVAAEHPHFSNLVLYPNPSTNADPLYLQFTANRPAIAATAQILDLTGRVLWSKNYDIATGLNTLTMDWQPHGRETMPNGVYSIVFTTDAGAVRRLFVVANR